MSLTVLQVIPALGTGGAEQAVVDIAAGLVARGDRAIVVSSGGRRVHELEEKGAAHILRNVNTKNPFKIIENAFWLADLIRREKIDVIHVRSRAPAWSARLARHMTKCRLVTTFHAAYKFSNEVKRHYNKIMTMADRVIAISPFIAAHIHHHYDVPEVKLATICRGIDLESFDPSQISEERKAAVRGAARVEPGEPVILLPARLSPIKGHETVIRALDLLRQKKTDLPVCLIVGDDQGRETYLQHLMDMIALKRLEDKVRLTGAWADMAAAYAIASLVLVPSRVPEGFGRVPVEAMAMGVPVIASNLGAMRDTVLDGETGWLVPPESVSAWAQAIEQALALTPAARKKMAKKARERAQKNFDRKKMVADTLAVYDALAT